MAMLKNLNNLSTDEAKNFEDAKQGRLCTGKKGTVVARAVE
jgi:hypothetical protein